MKVRKPDPKFIDCLDAYSPRIRELMLGLRKLVLEDAPESSEIVYDGSYTVSVIFTFSGRMREGFIHIAAYRDHVNLGFNRGVDLPDPDRVLQGSGTQIRHIGVRDGAELKEARLRHFIRLAIGNAPVKPMVEPQVILKVYEGTKKRPPRSDYPVAPAARRS